MNCMAGLGSADLLCGKFRRCELRQTRHSSLLLLCILLVSPGLLAQSVTYDEQLSLVAPSTSGETGLFTTITGDTLRQGDWSFGIYLNDYDLLAAPAREFAPLSGRPYQDMGYDDYQLSVSIGYGITDRWEVVASLPYHRLEQGGGDRAGFINGFLYDEGIFTDSGIGNLHLATKFGLLDPAGSNKLALSAFFDAPTGSDDSGIATGNPNFGLGAHWSHGIAAVSGIYKIVGTRDADTTPLGQDFDLPNEIHLDAGLNIPMRFFPTTNWISELNSIWYSGGDRQPDNPVFLVTGLRHWFGQSGWALNAGARWNVTKWSDDNEHCAFDELDDCALSGLVGLTYAPFQLAQLAAPPPPVVPLPPPPPAPTPIPPPPSPVVPPSLPRELRTDEIHFEPGSARLTNIAKAILDDVALRMKQEPSATAIVIGYTDNREATGPNTDLDRRRAEAVRDYLVSRHGIDPSRITVEGRGTSDPIGDNSTAAGRLANRRVVIRLMIP